MEISYYKTVYGYAIEVPDGCKDKIETRYFTYIGYSLKDAMKAWRKDFDLKYKHINFIEV